MTSVIQASVQLHFKGDAKISLWLTHIEKFAEVHTSIETPGIRDTNMNSLLYGILDRFNFQENIRKLTAVAALRIILAMTRANRGHIAADPPFALHFRAAIAIVV